MSRDAMQEVAAARVQGWPVVGEALASGLAVDDSNLYVCGGSVWFVGGRMRWAVYVGRAWLCGWVDACALYVGGGSALSPSTWECTLTT